MDNLTLGQQKDFKKKLRDAFSVLRKHGYFARQNFWCCQSCACADIPEEAENYVFYHNQDNQNIPSGKIHLAWDGDGNKITAALTLAGLEWEWDYSKGQRIKAIYVN